MIGAGDLLLDQVRHTNGLDVGASYTASATVVLPPNLVSGSYFVLVRTDSTDMVLEDALEGNNDTASGTFIDVVENPDTGSGDFGDRYAVPDLRLVSVDASDTAVSGQAFEITWTVENPGDTLTTSSWYDAIYLSQDQIFDRESDTYVGYRYHTGLAQGESYTETQTFHVPNGLSGSWYVFVATDSGNALGSESNEFDNWGYDGAAMDVVLPPPVDLVAGSITVPVTAVPGQDATISYTIENQSANDAIGGWYDSLYLSADGEWDIDDAFFGRVYHGGGVVAGARYSETLTAALPGVVPGDYQVIVRSDIRNSLSEADEDNNLGASLDSVEIDAELLAIDVPDTTGLAAGQSVYYRIEAAVGETLQVSIDSDSEAATNELYLRFGDMPTRAAFDYAHGSPFGGDQQIIVPETLAGTY